jgi:putative ABC transport system permease protein
MEGILQDLRFAVRSLLKHPALFAVATLSLALGISANTTIFAAIDAYLVRPLPYPDAERILQVWTTNAPRGWRRSSTSVPDFLDLRAASRTTELAALSGGSFNLSGKDRPERLSGSRVTPSFFSVMGVAPLAGRTFRPEEEQSGSAGVAVLSYAFWKRRFAADRSIVGQTLVLDGSPYTVVGIMPEDFKYPSITTDVWTPLTRTGSEKRDNRYLQVLARIRGSSSEDAARAELRSIAARLAKQYPENEGNGVNAMRLLDAIYGEEFHRGASISMVAVVFVLLIACANVANLLLARATGRARELALRTAIGAGRWRLIRQLLTESVVLAVCGGVLGTILSIWGVRAFVAIIPPNFARTETIALNGRALAFTLAVSVICGLVFGLAPALQATRANINAALREGGRGGTMGVRRNRLGATLVVAEISLALVLLISAGLLIKGSIRMQRTNLGFEPSGVLTARVALPNAQYPDSDKVMLFHSALLDRLRVMPGVQAVGAATDLPLEGGSGTSRGRSLSRDSRRSRLATSPRFGFRSRRGGTSPTRIALERRSWCSSVSRSSGATGRAAMRLGSAW